MVVFLLACFGITNIVIREYIFEKIRKSLNLKILNCETCFGFWVGCLMFWLLPQYSDYTIINIFVAGVISSGFNKLTLLILYKL